MYNRLRHDISSKSKCWGGYLNTKLKRCFFAVLSSSSLKAVQLQYWNNGNMFKYLVDKYKSMKGEYMSRSPKEKWKFVLNWAIFFQKITGVAVLDKNYEVYWYTYGLCAAFLDINISLAYSIWYYHSDSPLKGFLFMSQLGVCIPVKQISTLFHNSSTD